MPDVSMCKDAECPSREGCYRFIATPSELQAYGHFERPPGADKCSNHWPVKSKAEAKRLDRAHSDGW